MRRSKHCPLTVHTSRSVVGSTTLARHVSSSHTCTHPEDRHTYTSAPMQWKLQLAPLQACDSAGGKGPLACRHLSTSSAVEASTTRRSPGSRASPSTGISRCAACIWMKTSLTPAGALQWPPATSRISAASLSKYRCLYGRRCPVYRSPSCRRAAAPAAAASSPHRPRYRRFQRVSSPDQSRRVRLAWARFARHAGARHAMIRVMISSGGSAAKSPRFSPCPAFPLTRRRCRDPVGTGGTRLFFPWGCPVAPCCAK
mmetsp:Transcript_64958/g.205217  ORF Transcript_64958/g.205217 Transcript_64958/m.205217 type:complete len:256 (-) Transcript_64958:311-1078(-)